MNDHDPISAVLLKRSKARVKDELKRARKTRDREQRALAIRQWRDSYVYRFEFSSGNTRMLSLPRKAWAVMLSATAMLTPPIIMFAAYKLVAVFKKGQR